ncbi:MAG TPA: NAD(P)/FAD-dependent oxidoreductase [Chthonomonadaceae bacterium]|nr:NAD(P)/FAD-dependent oxidoreductase [Chthonomonadaceae bacterium]
MTRQYRIGIVGFGIAGGAAACLLARQGHSVTVFERAPQVGPVGTGLLLQLSGQTVLHRLGLLDPILAKSEPLTGLHAYMPNGKTLIHLRYAEVMQGHCGYGVHRGTLFEALRSAARADGIAICLDHEILDWREEGETVYAVSADGEEEGPFDFLIAADGSRSHFRQRLLPKCPAVEYSYGALWMLGRNTQVRGYLHQVISGTQQLLGLIPIGNERCTLFWGMRQDAMFALRERGVAAWREAVLRLCPLAEETLEGVESFDQVAFTSYRHSVPSRAFHGRVVCLGDAAHSMSPHLGQGANFALLDAARFADALQQTESLSEATVRYHHARRPAMRYYAALSRFLTPFFQSDVALLGWGRNVALPLICSIPPLRHEMTRAMAGIKQGLLVPNLDYETLLSAEMLPPAHENRTYREA